MGKKSFKWEPFIAVFVASALGALFMPTISVAQTSFPACVEPCQFDGETTHEGVKRDHTCPGGSPFKTVKIRCDAWKCDSSTAPDNFYYTEFDITPPGGSNCVAEGVEVSCPDNLCSPPAQ